MHHWGLTQQKKRIRDYQTAHDKSGRIENGVWIKDSAIFLLAAVDVSVAAILICVVVSVGSISGTRATDV
jgi:hypothetical protein